MQLKPIFDRLSKYTDKYQPQIDSFILRLKPIKDYWLRLSGRDQQVLMIAGGIVVLMFIVLIISTAIGIKNGLKINYTTIAEQRIDAQIIAQQYKDLSQITPNDFSSVNSDRIKGDATQILDVKDAEIIFSDNILTVKVGSAKFEKVMQFLDQLRKSYGLFPNTLTITRLSQPGYVALNVSFNNVEQQ